jgi:hypothetical protein
MSKDPAALAHATELAEARRTGAEDAATLAAEFAEIDARQRVLSRCARGLAEEGVASQ